MKKCCRCGRKLPRTRHYFQKLHRTKDGFIYHCKECGGGHFGKPGSKKIPSGNGLKICSKCGKELPLEMFTKLSRSYDGHHPKCKDCLNEHRRLYTEQNREYTRNKTREYRAKNRQAINKRNRERYAESEELRARLTMFKQIRCAQTRELASTLTERQWQSIKDNFDNRCCYCGKEEWLEQDHFVALSKGGEYTHNNILPACRSCNSSKKNQDFFGWYPRQPFYSKRRERSILKFLGYVKPDIQQPSLMI